MKDKSPSILVLHGPNLNLLGLREPDKYGQTTLDAINQRLKDIGSAHGYRVDTFQSNHEGHLVDRIHLARGVNSGILINPAAFTHTSIAVRDAILAVSLPTVEVHLSNVHRREAFRHRSYLADIAVGQVLGFGQNSYYLGLLALIHELEGAALAPASSSKQG